MQLNSIASHILLQVQFNSIATFWGQLSAALLSSVVQRSKTQPVVVVTLPFFQL